MKKLNILIIDSDDRGAQSSFPFHYRKLGHNVFMQKPNSPGLDWKRVLTWPRLLMKSQSEPTKRNLEIHGYPKDDLVVFGEDRFISQEFDEITSDLYASEAECDLIDLSDLNGLQIDAFHTTSNTVTELSHILRECVGRYIPNAKWISSTFTHWDHNPLGLRPQNVVRQLHANYSKAHQYAEPNNACNFYRHHTEFDLYNVKRDVDVMLHGKREGFSSFNHNFHVRQPDGYRLFTKMNELLRTVNKQEVINYGGNIRAHGADTRYSGTAGITGNYVTLSPRQAALKYLSSKAVVHFKNTDWAGGVPAYCRFSATPMITTQHYVDMSHSNEFLIHNYNCLIVKDAEEAAQAVYDIDNDHDLELRLRRGMHEWHFNAFNDQAYWDAWERMLNNLK